MKRLLFLLEWHIFPNWKTVLSKEIRHKITNGAWTTFEYTYFYDKYSKIRDEYKAASEANPATSFASEIVGGVAPALLTGGASLAGSVAKQGGKKLLTEAGKQSMKLGALQGGISGAGYSEGDTLEEVAKDALT